MELSLSRSAEALARAECIGDPILVFVAAGLRIPIAINDGDIDEVDRCLAITDTLVKQLRQPTLAWGHNFLAATRAQIAGEVDRAEQLANLALQIGTESGEPDAFLLYGTQFMAASWQRGTMGMLIPLVQQAIADNPGVPGLPAALAVAHLEAGENDEARRVLERGLESTTRQDGAWLTETTMFAEVAVECRAPDAATRLFELLSPWANQVSSSGMTAEGPVSHYLGGLAAVLGRYDEADTYFAHSAAFSDRVGAKFFAARTDLSWGRMLAEHSAAGNTEKAREFLTEAHTAAMANGYGTVERRVAAALQGLD